MPDHDLEPPRFSRKALERLLNDWPAVQCMIMSGVSENGTDQLFGDQGQLCRQSGTALLDKFTHSLLVKCSAEVGVKCRHFNGAVVTRGDVVFALFFFLLFFEENTRLTRFSLTSADAGYAADDFDQGAAGRICTRTAGRSEQRRASIRKIRGTHIRYLHHRNGTEHHEETKVNQKLYNNT